MYNLLDSVHIVVAKGKKRSTRAVESNRGQIEQAFQASIRILTGSKDVRILHIVKAILAVCRIDDCSQCFMHLEKKDVRRCSRCMIAKYCSRECQVEHWKSGSHKEFCSAAVKNARQIKSDGGTDAAVLFKNSILHMQMRGDEICLKNSATAVYQAISKGYEILDCIVDIDLRVSPPSIEVMLAEDFLSLHMNKESEMYAVKKMKVDEAREEKCLPFHYLGHEAGMVVLQTQPLSSAFPGCNSMFGPTWPQFQETLKIILQRSDTITKMAESVPGFMDKLEQFFVKYCMEKDGEDGKLRVRVLKKPNLPTDDDNLSSVVRDMFGAMKVKVENSEL